MDKYNKPYRHNTILASEIIENSNFMPKDPIIISEPSYNNKAREITFFTDGSVKGTIYDERDDVRSSNEEGITGYSACAFIDGKFFSKYQGTLGSTSNQAELKAMLMALQSIPYPKNNRNQDTNITIASDCKFAIDILRFHVEKGSAYRNAHDLGRGFGQLTDVEKNLRYNEKVLDKIEHIINQNENIKGVQLQWVKSHQLDKHNGKSLNGKNIVNDLQGYKRGIFNLLYGNTLSDYFANKGVDTLIKRLVDENISDSKSYKAGNGSQTLKLAIAASRYVRHKCLQVIHNDRNNTYSKNSIIEYLGADGMNSIETANKMRQENASPGQINWHLECKDNSPKFQIDGKSALPRYDRELLNKIYIRDAFEHKYRK